MHHPTRHAAGRAAWLALLAAALPAVAGPRETGAAGPAGDWKPAGPLSVGRYAPGAALLPDGRVVLAGGYSFETKETHATSEIFDPATREWRAGPRMRFDRNFPLSLVLPDGGALFAAGFRARAGTTATSERLSPDGNGFRPGEPAEEERELASVTKLRDGRYLITGGYTTLRGRTLASAELYDPKTDRFRPAGSLRHARFGHTGVLLPDGRVLLVGGKVLETEERPLPAELFDPEKETFTETGLLKVGRDRPTAWLLPDRKKVLVAGGSAAEHGTLPARRSELYDLDAGTFSLGPELIRDRMAHEMTGLGDGRVLLTGGWSTSENATTRQAELWDPESGRFLPAGLLRHGRHDHAALRLNDGRVLVAGGKQAPAQDGIETPRETEVWSPR